MTASQSQIPAWCTPTWQIDTEKNVPMPAWSILSAIVLLLSLLHLLSSEHLQRDKYVYTWSGNELNVVMQLNPLAFHILFPGFEGIIHTTLYWQHVTWCIISSHRTDTPTTPASSIRCCCVQQETTHMWHLYMAELTGVSPASSLEQKMTITGRHIQLCQSYYVSSIYSDSSRESK